MTTIFLLLLVITILVVACYNLIRYFSMYNDLNKYYTNVFRNGIEHEESKKIRNKYKDNDKFQALANMADSVYKSKKIIEDTIKIRKIEE